MNKSRYYPLYKALQTSIVLLCTLYALFFALSITAFAQSPRLLLLEEATNVGCAPCARENPVLAAFLKRTSDVVIPIAYHTWWPDKRDPFFVAGTNGTTTRIKEIGAHSAGIPFVCLNGKPVEPTTSLFFRARIGAASDTLALRKAVEELRGQTSPITIGINTALDKDSLNIHIVLNSTQKLSEARLYISLVEEYATVQSPPSQNGETTFPNVARALAPFANGTELPNGEQFPKEFRYRIRILPEWNRSAIRTVVFVRNSQTKEVLQTAQSDFIVK